MRLLKLLDLDRMAIVLYQQKTKILSVYTPIARPKELAKASSPNLRANIVLELRDEGEEGIE